MEKIMNKIGKKATETCRIASKQASKIAKEIKLKTQMSENKNKIQEFYEDIGKTVYEKYILKEEINVERDLLNNCSIINTLAEENESLRMQLLELKDLKQCPKCHYEIYYDFHFCPNCGYVQDDTNAEAKSAKQNDGPATIVTTDVEDANLKNGVDSNIEKDGNQELPEELEFESNNDD